MTDEEKRRARLERPLRKILADLNGAIKRVDKISNHLEVYGWKVILRDMDIPEDDRDYITELLDDSVQSLIRSKYWVEDKLELIGKLRETPTPELDVLNIEQKLNKALNV